MPYCSIYELVYFGDWKVIFEESHAMIYEVYTLLALSICLFHHYYIGELVWILYLYDVVNFQEIIYFLLYAVYLS